MGFGGDVRLGNRREEPFDLGVLIDTLPQCSAGAFCWPEHAYAHLCTSTKKWEASVCLVMANHIDLVRGRAGIWWYDGSSRRWERSEAPLPRVLYNRISRRQVESSRAGRRLLRALAQRRPLFNPGFFDKAQVYQTLAAAAEPGSDAGAPGNEALVPDFHLLQQVETALDFYHRYGDVYLKPSGGSLGRGMARLYRLDRGRSRLAMQTGPGAPVEDRILDESAVRGLLHSLSRGPLYIVQKTIPLIRRHGRPVDVRVLVQKETTGRWSMTGAAGRMAATGRITTHTVHGGDHLSLERLAEDVPSALASIRALEAVCLRAAAILDAAWNGALFELSFDVAPTPCGPPLILEANAKPFPFDETEVRERARQKILRYALARAA